MIYLKDLSNNIREFKDGDSKTVNAMIDSGRWVKCAGRKDLNDYVKPKKAAKKKSEKTK